MNEFTVYRISEAEKREVISRVSSELFKREEIIFAYLFGSFIEPEMPGFRDIDLGVYVKPELIIGGESNSSEPEAGEVTVEGRLFQYGIRLSIALERVIKRYPFDVVVLNNAPLSLIFRITQGRILFIKDEELWTDFVTRIWSLYHDHAITSRYILEDIIKS
jgi:predicted nucleotidyltransferase